MAETQVADPRLSMVEYVSMPKVRNDLDKVKTNVLDPEKVVRLALNAMQITPKLHECTLESMMGCLMTATGLGLEPNTPLQHAWIIPYDNWRKIENRWQTVTEAQFMIGYKGFVDLMWRADNLEALIPGAARKGDLFESYVSSDVEGGTFFKFQKELVKERGELIASFTYSQTGGSRGSGKMATVMTRDEVLKRRSRSYTYNSLVQRAADAKGKEQAKAAKKLAETPWVLWEDEMWTKTAIRTHAGYMPLTPLVMAAVAIDAAGDEGRIDMRRLGDPEHLQAVTHGETPPPEIVEGDYERVDPAMASGPPDDGAPPPAGDSGGGDDPPPADESPSGRARGRPRLTEEEKKERAAERKRAKEEAKREDEEAKRKAREEAEAAAAPQGDQGGGEETPALAAETQNDDKDGGLFAT